MGKSDFILTSNRDEAPGRNALKPKHYYHNDVRLLFPKDEQSSGTWIGLSEKSRLICLLNGGFEKHKRQERYRLSRGEVVKDLLAMDDIAIGLDNYDLDAIEPFTK